MKEEIPKHITVSLVWEAGDWEREMENHWHVLFCSGSIDEW